MDNITHALAGVLLADVTTALVARRSAAPVPSRFRRAATLVGVAAAELPDADLLYAGPLLGMGKLGYLMHHRGHTHTIVWALLAGMALWWGTRWWWRRRGDDTEQCWWSAHGSRALLALALIGALSHLLLDWTNSYGVHPFWPIDNRWFYGDAVFIVEPWLWMLAIPALFWGERTRGGRLLLGVLLVLMVAAMWGLGQVAPGIAAAGTVVAVVGLVVQRLFSPVFRLVSGISAWGAVTLLFATSGAVARAQVIRTLPDGALRDVVLNPAPGDPSCWSAIAVTGDAVFYRVSTGLVTPWPGGDATVCAARYPSGRLSGDGLETMRTSSPNVPFMTARGSVHWRRTWAVPRVEMLGLAADRCEFAVALRFMRVPVWEDDTRGVIHLSDLRFGTGGGFADLDIAPFPAPCSLTSGRFPPWVPAWVPPRDDMLHGGE